MKIAHKYCIIIEITNNHRATENHANKNTQNEVLSQSNET